ncbi:MAG: tripartite tricarboxylate transporter substrate binding protein [Betaproteobacteria bacterium]|nr:tripartite tricarboxylate transporter substrate binding protein [Betaproteobacteria bacterium]
MIRRQTIRVDEAQYNEPGRNCNDVEKPDLCNVDFRQSAAGHGPGTSLAREARAHPGLQRPGQRAGRGAATGGGSIIAGVRPAVPDRQPPRWRTDHRRQYRGEGRARRLHIFLATNDSLVANQFRLKSLPYDVDRDFTPVANVVGSAAFVVVANGEMPVKTFPDLAAMARAQPGKVSMGITVGLSDIISQWLNKLAAIDLLRVPYKLNTQANQDAAAGQVNSIITSYQSIVPLVQSGRLRVIAVTGSERYPLLPEIPTLGEAYPGLVIEGWFFFVAPAGTPADIVQRMNREVDRIVADPEIAGRIRGFHFTPGPAMTPKGIEDRIREERVRWRRIVQDIGLQPQ